MAHAIDDLLWHYKGVIICPPYGKLEVDEVCTWKEFADDMPPGARFYGGSSIVWCDDAST